MRQIPFPLNLVACSIGSELDYVCPHITSFTLKHFSLSRLHIPCPPLDSLSVQCRARHTAPTQQTPTQLRINNCNNSQTNLVLCGQSEIPVFLPPARLSLPTELIFPLWRRQFHTPDFHCMSLAPLPCASYWRPCPIFHRENWCGRRRTVSSHHMPLRSCCICTTWAESPCFCSRSVLFNYLRSVFYLDFGNHSLSPQGLHRAASLSLPNSQYFSSFSPPHHHFQLKRKNCLIINIKHLSCCLFCARLYILTHLIFTSTQEGSRSCNIIKMRKSRHNVHHVLLVSRRECRVFISRSVGLEQNTWFLPTPNPFISWSPPSYYMKTPFTLLFRTKTQESFLTLCFLLHLTRNLLTCFTFKIHFSVDHN